MKRLMNLVLITSLAACGGATEGDKGAEESPLTGGKDDSFARPTEHGALQFGVPNEARMTEEENFHAWTFELSGAAEVGLETKISQNLDTVMYLYRRDSPDDSWGRYIDKNDDHGDSVASRIELSGEAGEYRIIVKGFKTSLRGSFSVAATCEGDGCRAPDAGECVAGEFESLPRWTDFSDGCTKRIMGVLRSPERSSASTSVALADQCNTSGMVRRGFDGYAAYWEDIAGLDVLGEEDEMEFNITVSERADGHVVDVDAGGDEDGLTLVYDNDGALLLTYQHNQSPTVDYYCATAEEETFEGPWAECFSDIMQNAVPDDIEPERTESGEALLETIVAEVDIAYVGEATADYAQVFEHDFVDTQLVEYTVEEFGSVVRISLFTVAEDSTALWADYTFIPDRNGLRMVRESAWDSTMTCE